MVRWLNKLHNWLIVTIVGNKPVMMNIDLQINGTAKILNDFNNGGVIKKNIFRGGSK